MGTYVNPGNQAFAEITKEYYVDKTGLIALINKRMNGPDKLVFQNDFETFTCKDDVLTLLVHLGYLTYEEEDTTWSCVYSE